MKLNMLNFYRFFCCFNKKNIIVDNYKKFDLNDISGNFYVKSVYDGDTITILIPININIYDMNSSNSFDLNSNKNIHNKIFLNEIKVRLSGIDTPEIKPRLNIINREEHIKKAKEARDFLSNLILNKIIYVKLYHNDKYGRPLVDIYYNDIHLNNLLLEKGFANKYDGKTKDSNFK